MREIPGGAHVGLGSGRAAEAFVRALAAAAKQGLEVRGVPTSRATAALAASLGLALTDLPEDPLDLTVDGADEVDPQLDLVKGYGGALARERIVAAASRRQVILVTDERARAAPRYPGPAAPSSPAVRTAPVRAAAGRPRVRPRLREAAAGPFVTDNGNWILDCGIPVAEDAAALDRDIRRIPGVVETGFFLGTAEQVLVAQEGTVRVLRRGGGPAGN